MTLEELTEAVWKRLEERPRALLIGKAPDSCHKYNYVNNKPYSVIILGELPPGELLRMPNCAVCEALLEGIPVYLWHGQLHHRGRHAKLLRKALYDAEEKLFQYGVQPLGVSDQLITAEKARQLCRVGALPQEGSRLTPLAKDILEGRAK